MTDFNDQQALSTDDTTSTGSSSQSGAAESGYYTNLSSAMIGAGLTSQESGDQAGFFSHVSDYVQKGIPLTAAATANSFYNTAVEVGNVFGLDAQKATIEDEFGPDTTLTAYYQQHTGLVEGGALAVGSLLPGLGATKLLKLAQVGKFGTTLQTATGLFSGIRDTAIAGAQADLLGNSLGTSLFGLNTVNKVKAIAAGVADEALQGAAYQTATLATMHASPLLDNNTLGDNVSDVFDAMKGFGIVGGIFKGASAVSAINRASRSADLATKAQEIVGASGIGDLTPGDRTLNLFSQLDTIPTDNLSRLAQSKYDGTVKVTGNLVRQQLIKAAGGDVELGNTFANKLEEWRQQGMDSDTQSNLLSQLSKIGRHGNIDIASTANDVFYLPKSVAPDVVSTIDHPNLMSRIASDTFADSKAYVLNDQNSLPIIARATDRSNVTPIAPGSTPLTFPKFSSATDAFKQGADIYIGKDGTVAVNSAAPNFSTSVRPGESRQLTNAERPVYNTTGNLPKDSLPLNAVGMTVDLQTGKIFGEAPLPVVGDIARPQLAAKGLQVGDTLFTHTLENEITATTPSLEANSRYVWASLRGVKAGDAISPTDLPMVEQLYREQVAGNSSASKLLNGTFSDGSPIPTSNDALLQHIVDTKQRVLGTMLADGKTADEISQAINAPPKALSNNFQSFQPQDVMNNPADSMGIRHVRLAYDIGTTKDSEGNLLRGMQATAYRTQLADTANTDAATNYFAQTIGKSTTSPGAVSDALAGIKLGDVSKADIQGAGPGLFTSANADYGTFAQRAERAGATVSQLGAARLSVVGDTLAGAANAVRGDAAAAAEYGNFRFVRQSTAENYVALSDADAATLQLPKNTVVLEGAISRDAQTGDISLDHSYLPEGFTDGSSGAETTGLRNYYTLSQKVMDLERASQTLTNTRNDLQTQWWQAQGINKPKYNPDVLYSPPINTAKQPFIAYVRQTPGTIMGESGSSVIVAKNASELQKKISLIGPQFQVVTKDDIANFKQAQGEYDYNRNFTNTRVQSELQRKGILNNLVPETRGDNLINDLADWHNRQELSQLRDHVELANAQTFAQLRAMGDRFDSTNNSQLGQITSYFKPGNVNPYQSYIRTALGIGAKDDYPFLSGIQEKISAYGDQAFNAAREAFGAMKKGLLTPEQATEVSRKFGLGTPYGTAIDEMQKNYYGGLANSLPDKQILGKFVGTANSALGATVIRLDAWQQLIHMVTTPIMAAMEYGPATKDISNLLSVGVPGTTNTVPGFTRALFNAVRTYFGPQSEDLQKLYQVTGDELSLHRQMIDNFSMPRGQLSDAGWAQKIEAGTDIAQRLTGTNFVNKFNKFIVSDVGRQIAQAQGLDGQQLLDSIGTFVNRSLGNHAAGQRAAIFSGPVGQAVGLFQSYQMNLMQQLLRHIGNGDIKAVAIGAGLQSSVFGLSSLPGFQALNSMIQQRDGNVAHQDLYSAANETVGHSAANYLLYGSLSGLLDTSLYSRGDLNPRRATVLPVNPLQFTSVQAGIKIYTMLDQLQNNVIQQGGSVPTSLLLAAEHNGLSRPLSGLAQYMQGFSTTPDGKLIASTTPDPNAPSNAAGLSNLFSIANFSRILGARPLDEAVGMDALYRNNAAKATDLARIKELSEAAKTELYNGGDMAPQETQRFMANYARAGGIQTHFNQWMLGVAKDANVSAVNKTFQSFNEPYAQTLQTVMGGVPLPDFRNTGTTQVAPSAPGVTPPMQPAGPGVPLAGTVQ